MIGRLVGGAVIGYITAKHGDKIAKVAGVIKEKVSKIRKSDEADSKSTIIVSNDSDTIIIDGEVYKKKKKKK